ncbi:MAG: DHH family phosphoesterase [Candidatus Nomurabacteria bacterium]|nr:DHH family phosphoesterase [Candidatus Nomurabacteria bacterium]
MKPILITSYVNPDIDGMAGVFAYSEFLEKTGINNTIGVMGEIHDEAKYVLDRFNFEYPPVILNSNNFEKVILIDTSDLNGIEGNIELEKVIEIIDHRTIHEADKFPNAKIQIELVGSVATLITERFIQKNIEISKKSAILLLSAIISNTLNFKGGVTTERDKKAAKYLTKIAQLADNFWKELFEAKSDLSGNKLKDRILGDLAWFNIIDKKVGIAQLEIIGVKKLIEKKQDEIIEILENIKKEMNFDLIFLNAIELEEYKNFFVTSDDKTKYLLEKILNVKFDGFVAEKSNLIMRKQIVPLLKEELEK